MIPGRDHISKAPKREALFGAYIELREKRNISSTRQRARRVVRQMVPVTTSVPVPGVTTHSPVADCVAVAAGSVITPARIVSVPPV